MASGTEESQRGDAKSHGPFGLIIGVAFLVAITLSSPFLEIGEAPIGVLIIAIGLWEAWRRTRGVPTLIEGPFRVAPGAAGLPPA